MEKSIGERLREIGARYPIDDSLSLGIDLGIASVGSAVVRSGDDGWIEFAGSRCFEASEVPKTRELKNKARRANRLMRRVVRRRARRMADIRALLLETGLLETAIPSDFHTNPDRPCPDPWRARAYGLDHRLPDAEFASALLHIAKHRGFKSNSKTDAAQNAPDDNKKMLGATEANKELLARYRSVGEMVVNDDKFARTKRNKGGDYAHTHYRDTIAAEVATLFAAQRRLGNQKATTDLEEAFVTVAFFQRGLKDSEDLVGSCPFEPSEKRAPRHAPSFEKFRFLQKLTTMRVRTPDGLLRRLTPQEMRRAESDFGTATKSISWNALAKKLGLVAGTAFDGINDDAAKKDIATTRGSAAGTKALYDVLGPAGWNTLRAAPERLDAIASVLAFRDDLGRIAEGLAELGLEPIVLNALVQGSRDGAFADFKRAGHISAKAARAILPGLRDGLVYSDACAAAGYDHTTTRRVTLDDIANPVVQRSLREAVKQVETLIHRLEARPGRIVVELARDVGKSAQERDEITRGIDRRTAQKEKARKEFRELLGKNESWTPNEEELRRFELWKEQGYTCLYSGQDIHPTEILGNATQVDHVLPRSRSQDNSYRNQVLCRTSANQDKGQRTPWEWKGNDAEWWGRFEARVGALHVKASKKRLLLMRNFDERERGFVERNLNDTKYATRALLAMLRDLYDDIDEPDPAGDGYLRNPKRRLFALPGAITAMLRRAWGLDRLKDRADDRHHALDALICAASRGAAILNTLTRQYQRLEAEHRAGWTPAVDEPWPAFRNDAVSAYESVFVSRSEKRRGRGQGHEATFYAFGTSESGTKITYERKAVEKITKADLDRLKDGDGGNRPIREALSAWIEAGKPADASPRSAKGDPIRKVSLARSKASGFELNGGHVDNADMVRVDVFAKPNRKGKDEFYLVPIYRHQVMNPTQWPRPPDRAVRAYTPEEEWTVVDSSFEFRFSLYPDAYVEVVKRDGSIFEGYYRSMNRATGAIGISPHNQRGFMHESGGIGAKTLHSFRKFQVDRLGDKHPIEREVRTWHGAACT